MKSVSVILPNFNGSRLLQDNLPSLFDALQYYGAEYEVIVVDDCSTDNSCAFLERYYPQINLLRNEVNLGFSATCNRGIHAAQHELVCVCNTDVTFTETYFSEATKYFTDCQLFAVKGLIINYAESFDNVINNEATSLLYYKRGFLRFNQRVEPQPDKLTGRVGEQFVLLGCCFVADREKLWQLGGYNEIFSPYYWEDSDLPLRALELGYSLVYAPECKVFHRVSSTIGITQSNTKRRLVSIRNKILFTWFHLHGGTRRASHLFWLLTSIATRWLVLDWKFYVSLIMALYRLHQYHHESMR